MPPAHVRLFVPFYLPFLKRALKPKTSPSDVSIMLRLGTMASLASRPLLLGESSLLARAPFRQPRMTARLPFHRLPRRSSAFHSSSRRRVQTGEPFQPLRPTPPSSLGPPRPAREFRQTRRWTRRLAVLSLLAGGIYLVDRYRYGSGLARSLLTFGTGIVVALDYKINFRPTPLPIIGSSGDVSDLHRRNAERLFDLLRGNGGLYLKIGQAIAMQSAVLPPEFQRMFARMFDDAPQDEWSAVEQVIREDFGGRSVQDVFDVSFTGEDGKGVMERTARASASVAQVHWARLSDGREVAVKIQKPEIQKQIGWDLWSFKWVLRGIPVMFPVCCFADLYYYPGSWRGYIQPGSTYRCTRSSPSLPNA